MATRYRFRTSKTRPVKRRTIRARAARDASFQRFWASRAQETARLTSAGAATVSTPITSPVTGFRTSITSPTWTVNYNPPMDKEALQRQLEDMEEESERWRAEKRRLNAEIDKLEAALADVKGTPGRKCGGTAPTGKPDAIDHV